MLTLVGGPNRFSLLFLHFFYKSVSFLNGERTKQKKIYLWLFFEDWLVFSLAAQQACEGYTSQSWWIVNVQVETGGEILPID